MAQLKLMGPRYPHKEKQLLNLANEKNLNQIQPAKTKKKKQKSIALLEKQVFKTYQFVEIEPTHKLIHLQSYSIFMLIIFILSVGLVPKLIFTFILILIHSHTCNHITFPWTQQPNSNNTIIPILRLTRKLVLICTDICDHIHFELINLKPHSHDAVRTQLERD